MIDYLSDISDNPLPVAERKSPAFIEGIQVSACLVADTLLSSNQIWIMVGRGLTFFSPSLSFF